MALYHMFGVLGVNSSISLASLRRYVVRVSRDHALNLVKTWHRKSRPFILSSSLIVLRKQDDPIITPRNRSLILLQCNYAELSPKDDSDDSFLSSLRTSKLRPAMKFLEELKESLPSSSDFEQAKAKLSSQLSEFTQRLSDTTTDDIKDQASIEAALLTEAVTEVVTDTKKLVTAVSSKLIKEPTPPGTPVPRFTNNGAVPAVVSAAPTQVKRDLALPQDIIDQNKQIEQHDTELLPRFKTAVRQFKAEIEADQSGDPPISLVSRKAKERIENFIQAKKKQFRGEKSRVETDSAPLRRTPSVPPIPEDKEESIMDYIISNVPGLKSQTVPDPELEDIMSMQKGTYYNDSFLVDTIDIEDEVLLISQGWTKEMSKPNLNIWKKHLEEEGLSLYKIFGKLNDISALEFYNAQVNDEHRMVWDSSVDALHVLDVIDNNTEIMYWAVKFPFPLMNRDYVFERIHKMDESRARLEVTSRSVTHRSKPESPKYARVLRYGSRMVVIGDQSLTNKGMSYVLTYYDDFRAPIPTHWMDRFANERIPDFLNSVHDAAQFLGKNGNLFLPYADKKKRK